MNPKHVARPRAEPDGGAAFLPDPRHPPAHGHRGEREPLAEMVAREYLEAVTCGEEHTEKFRDAVTTEELGGPFVEHSASQEFGMDREFDDEEDPTEREAFPTAMRGAAG